MIAKFSYYVAITTLFSIVKMFDTAVIGIDFGTEFYKISLISPGKSFVIIENVTSKRKTPTAVFIHYFIINLTQKFNFKNICYYKFFVK